MSLRMGSFVRGALALALAAGPAMAETFTYIGGTGAQNWAVAGNWLGDVGFGDPYPGAALLVDNANLNVNLGSGLTLDIAAPTTVATLNMGDSNAAPGAQSITTSGTGVLSATTIGSLGVAGATNNIAGSFAIPAAGTTIAAASTNPLNFTGTVVLPVGGSRTLRNSSTQIANIGAVSLSGGTAAGNLFFRNDTATTVMNMNGVISNGAIAPAGSGTVQVRYAGGTFHNFVDNTYTGATQLGENSPNSVSTNIIYSDGVFGTGRLSFGGGAAIKTVEGAAGLGDRTLANEVQLSRDARFAGSENITLTGQVFQSNTRTLFNDIAAGKVLAVNGPVFTDSGTNAADLGRRLTFGGSGRTEVSGTIDDKVGLATAQRGIVRQGGPGRTVFMNNSVVAYGAGTEVFDGTLQLGTGNAAVGLNGHALSGTPTGSPTTGTLEINHSASLNLDTSTSYNMNINHVGSGTTTLSDNNFGSGTINVSNGKLLVNGGAWAGQTVLASPRDPAVTGNTAILGGFTVAQLSAIHIGQPVTGTPNGGTGVFPTGAYVQEIDTVNNRILISGNIPTSVPNTWDLTFEAGTGTGTSNVIVGANGTVGGTGIIGGFLGANGTVAPGASVGTLTVNGNGIFNGTSTLAVEYDSSLGGQQVDILAVGGNLTLNSGSTISFANLNSPNNLTGSSYLVASYLGTLTGTFTNVLSIPAGYFLDYGTGSNSNITLNAVPEAGAFLAGTVVSLLVGAGAMLRRRRK